MTDRPWESESDGLEFEADGLPCVMWRNYLGVWCGYVSVGPEHPLFGLPINHPLKLPAAWFKGRKGLDEGTGPMDLFMHLMSGKELTDACAISLAFQVHGGVSYADNCVPDHEPDGRWWFGFDCGHAGDFVPGGGNVRKIMDEMVDSMPAEARGIMRKMIMPIPGVYRDQQYVVSECQSLAAQLIAIADVVKENINGSTDDRRDRA